MPRTTSIKTPAKPAARKPQGEQAAVSIDTLSKLGAKRLAALLFEVAENDAALAKRLRVELLKNDPAALAREIDKQIASLKRARSRQPPYPIGYIPYSISDRISSRTHTRSDIH